MLCLDALGSERVTGVYVDTGLMREGETQFVRETFGGLGLVRIEDASEEFLNALEGVREPELKRHIIGEQFVKIQERIIEERGLMTGNWILGQGTIYPDTIESGGTARAATIKTHHNRVPGIQKLIDEGRIVEPLSDFYKDEVRAIGRELGLARPCWNGTRSPGRGWRFDACARTWMSRCIVCRTDTWFRYGRWGCRAISGRMRRCWRSMRSQRWRRDSRTKQRNW